MSTSMSVFMRPLIRAPLLLYPAPHNSYRGLFYKGDGDDHMDGASLSARLCPRSNRIALRVTSTKRDQTVSVDSVAALGVHTWNHVAFAFENNTQEGGISAKIFINGVTDISATFRDVDRVRNDDPLLIGRHPGNNGNDGPGPR